MKDIKRLGALCLIIMFAALLPITAFGEQERYNLPVGSSVAQGPDNAPVTIFEFLDFQ